MGDAMNRGRLGLAVVVRLAVVLTLAGVGACSGGDRSPDPDISGSSVSTAKSVSTASSVSSASEQPPHAATAVQDSSASGEATPVRVASVILGTIRVTVDGPGHTAVLRQERVRAPFAGTLISLAVSDGDRVQAGQVLGTLISRSSEAALSGARAMMATSRTAADSLDAARALTLARETRVERPLRATGAGVVFSHSASTGDRVAEGDEIVSLASAGSVIFVADMVQSDLPKIQDGQPARITLAAREQTLTGVVHGILPAANSAALSAPVRIDFTHPLDPPAVGLFGHTTIVVEKRRGVIIVPAQAVLTDDVTGTSRIAVVRAGGIVHWIPVEPGYREGDRIEVRSPGLASGDRFIVSGDRVIVSGQVGLPEGSRIRITP